MHGVVGINGHTKRRNVSSENLDLQTVFHGGEHAPTDDFGVTEVGEKHETYLNSSSVFVER